MPERSRVLFAIVTLLPLAGASAAAQSSWTVYRDDRGTRVDYPSRVFSMARGPGESGVGQVFETPDGRARLHIYSIPNPRALSPAAFLRSEFPAVRSSLSYDRVTRTFFAISSRRDGMIVYMRCNFSARAGGSLHCIDLRYPAAEKRAWDSIVTRISRSLRPLPR